MSSIEVWHAWYNPRSISGSVWYLSEDGKTEVECTMVERDYRTERHANFVYRGKVTQYLRGSIGDPSEDAWMDTRYHEYGKRELPVKEDIQFDSLGDIELSLPQNQPCPRAYTGAGNCTCGKCHKTNTATINRNPFGY